MKTGEPILIEAIAYRLGAHSTSDDPTGYRSKEEESNNTDCPIQRFKGYLLSKGWLDEESDNKADEQLREQILRCR